MEGERVNLLQLDGGDLDTLVAAARARGPILALNYPAGSPAAKAMHDADATAVVGQFEMSLAL
jgi:hypothetical protein